MPNDAQAINAGEDLTAQRKNFCLLFCGLVLAYKRDRRPEQCIEMIGLPRQFVRLMAP